MWTRLVLVVLVGLLALPGCSGGGSPCEPDCNGRQCGDDGCGGSCGACDLDLICSSDGRCCEPSCEDRVCGDDGCGGSCGECTGEDVCHAGRCVNYPRKFPGPCVVAGDMLIDGREDYRFTYAYDDHERLITEDHDIPSDGIIDKRIAYQYDGAGRLVVREYDDWADGETDFRAAYTYYPTGQVESYKQEDFRESPTWIAIDRYYYDEIDRLETKTMDTRDDGVIESVFAYTYYEDTDLLSVMERDDLPLGSADIRWLYYYEENTVIEDYDKPIGGPIEARVKYYNDDAGNLVREEWDNNADDRANDVFVWEYNADGCLVRRDVDYDFDQELDGLYIYEQDRFCNLLQSWEGNAGGFNYLVLSDYSCWLE